MSDDTALLRSIVEMIGKLSAQVTVLQASVDAMGGKAPAVVQLDPAPPPAVKPASPHVVAPASPPRPTGVTKAMTAHVHGQPVGQAHNKGAK